MSEDLPHADSRVLLRPDGAIQLNWRRSNLRAHRTFVGVAKRLLKDVGFPIVLSKPFGTDTPSHQCGTARFGDDPAASVLDHALPDLGPRQFVRRRRELLPSSAALNPALTVAAQALRAAQHIKQRLHDF